MVPLQDYYVVMNNYFYKKSFNYVENNYKCEEIRIRNHTYNVSSTMQNKYRQRKKTKKKYANMLTMVISR